MSLKKVNETTIGKRLIEKFPGKIPIVVTLDKLFIDTNVEKKVERYTIDETNTVGVLINYIRKNMKLNPNEAIYLLTDKTSLSASLVLIQVYERHKNLKDDCLYINVVKENVFGCDIYCTK